jgi:DNA (cytosine-5)-methyltransferase 1
MNISKPIPVIDLFAGPGGLGEGFSALTDEKGNRVFRIALSVEKDEYAHQTLELRSFFRQFEKGKVPEKYYQHLRGEISRKELFDSYTEQANIAKAEALKIELGKKEFENEIDEKIADSLKNENKWILIGGPPCQAYSLVGRSRKKQKDGLDEEDEKVYLYRAYYRILAKFNPPLFIMENVKGLLSSRVRGEKDLLFKQILNDLKNPLEAYKKLNGKSPGEYKSLSYKIYSLVKEPRKNNLFTDEPEFEVGDFIVKCENYSIPQMRHRVILLGIREDKNIVPDILERKDKIIIEKVLNGLPKLRSGLSKEKDSKKNWAKVLNDFITKYLQREIDPEVFLQIKKVIGNLTVPQKDRGKDFLKCLTQIDYKEEEKWFLDPRIKGVCNHSTRSHLTEDLYRYLFASCYARIKNKSPKLEDFPKKLLPKHKNAKDGKFEDRFRVQIFGEPARTITSHISKDGHYYIHPDPTQCRSLTVREAARIQTFPDNYFFCGPRTSQYIQVGNAVPTLLAREIAKIIVKLF